MFRVLQGGLKESDTGAELHSYTDHAESFQERASSRFAQLVEIFVQSRFPRWAGWAAFHRLHIDLVITGEAGCRFLDNFEWTFIFSETNET